MTNERAIELLHRLQDEQFDGIHGDERMEALSMAVRALEGDGDTIYRQDDIDAICKACSLTEDYHKCDGYPEESTWCEELVALRALSSAQPTFTEAEIQRMQELDSAQIQKAYEVGYEEGKKERKKGKWIKISPANIYECSECGKNVMTDDISVYDFCHGCGARMDGESDV